jgi:hypothetical protein
MTEDNNTTNVQLENGSPAFAKPVLNRNRQGGENISFIELDFYFTKLRVHSNIPK